MSHVDPVRAAAEPSSTEALDPWLGRVIAGEFELVQRLGAGVQGTVYRALQQPFDRPVAVKLLTGEKAADPQYRLRFLREARALELLHHPAIVRLLRFGTIRDEGVETGGLFIAEELVEGTSLEQVIDAQGPLHPARALRIALQVLDALAVAHRHGVVHRDIKPAHILLRRDPRGEERVTLIDFGLARRENGFDDDDEDLTDAGWMLGSPLYMAPEPLAEVLVGPAADQYSLGIVLYEMLTGQPPFSGSLESVLLSHAVDNPPALPAAVLHGDVLDGVLQRALAKDPAGRYADPAAMSAALEQALALIERADDTLVDPPGADFTAWLAAREGATAAEPGDEDDDEDTPLDGSFAARARTLPPPSRSARWLLTATGAGVGMSVASAAAAASAWL